MPPSNPSNQPPTTEETSAPDRPEHTDQAPEIDNNSSPLDDGQPSTTADDPPQSATPIRDDAEETTEPPLPEETEQTEQTGANQNPDANTNTMDTDSPDNSTEGNAASGGTAASPEEEQEQQHQDGTPDEQDDDEHPYWAEFEEDTSAPDDDELKEIESGQGDHSAYEYDFWEESCFKPLDDPEYQPSEKARVTWKIKGVRGTPEKPNRALIIRSPAAYVGGYYWSLKFFPRGNSISSLSLYVECSPTPPEPDEHNLHTEFKVVKGPPDAVLSGVKPDVELTLPATQNKRKRKQAPGPAEVVDERHEPGETQGGASSGTTIVDPDTASKQNWRVSAEVGAVLYNPNEPRTGHFHSASHQFNAHNNDWGWTNFHGPWDQIHCRQRGQRQALLRDDTLAFDMYIRIVDDPTHSLWWHSSDSEPVWDSVAVTGYKAVGDDSENYSHEVAGLVAWLMISPVREVIQNIDILEHLQSSNVKPRPLCNALQRFLYSLRNDPPAPQLYVSAEGVMLTLRNLRESSRDPIGFWEVLRRSLELELEGTSAKAELARIFDSGDTTNEVNCLPREYNSRIVLPAGKTSSIQSGLTSYLGGKPGKWSLPPVLHVELARQTFDKPNHHWKMLLDRVRMDENLDLSNFVPRDQNGKYTIYGFVVHKGPRTSSKFYSILRPEGPGTRWLAFEDASDRNVFCLTRKAAVEGHEGLDSSKDSDEKNPPDVAVAVLYVRNDVLADYLPKKLEKWEMPKLREHYFQTTNSSLQLALQETSRETIQVELYNLPDPSSIHNNLFDAYDLMFASRAAGECCTLNLAPDTTFADMRKQYAQRASSGKNKETDPENIRFWKVGARQAHCPPALHLETIQDLSFKISIFELDVLRLWVHFLSEDDAQYFAQLDPDPPSEVVPVEGQDSNGDQAQEQSPASTPAEDGDTAMTDDNAAPDEEPVQGEDSPPPDSGDPAENEQLSAPEGDESQQQDTAVNGESQQQDATMNGVSTADEAAIAAAIADDVEELDRTEESDTWQPSSSHENAPSGAAGADGDVVMEDTQATGENSQPLADDGSELEMDEDEDDVRAEEPPARRPKLVPTSSHFYFFVQIFDEEKQELRYAGSFLANRSDGAKLAVLKALEYPVGADYLVWQRIDGPLVVSVPGTQLFEDIVPYTHEGDCFIVGKDLTSTQRTKLSEAGLFPTPHGLVQYHWDLSRRHPINSFTGKKAVEASYGGYYYSGDFKNGQWHGKGTHISDTGATYVGDFVLGQRQGTGSMMYATGDTYEGDWSQDQRHGQGTFIERKTGNKYVGGYRSGKRHGKGISYWEVADEEMGLCQICYTEEQDALFYPCGHVCACVECASQVDICPMCRQKSVNVVKIYKS